jgi:ribonuclease III
MNKIDLNIYFLFIIKMEESNDIKVIVNPYNFNNKLLTENNVYSIIRNYDIQGNIYSMKYYQLAFIHSSYTKKLASEIGENVVLAKKPEGALELMDGDYERLEFLGDAVVSIVVAKYLFERFPDENEGFLTKMRTKLVNGEMLGYLASKLGFGEFAIMSRHIEDKCKGRTSQHILEDMFEAFVGAMFLDFNEIDNYNLLDNFYSGIGFQICEKFIIHVIEEHVDFSELILKNNNYKEMLTKYFNETYDTPINFSDPTVEGGLNDRLYTVDVLDDKKVSMGTGVGKSKKKAEQYACKDSLINLKLIT